MLLNNKNNYFNNSMIYNHHHDIILSTITIFNDFQDNLKTNSLHFSCLSINGTIYYMQETDDDVSRSMSDTELLKDSQKK